MKSLVIAMLFIALFKLPYGYYTLLRIVCSVSFLIFAHRCNEDKINGSENGKTIFYILAFVFNPIIPLPFPREIWAVIDVVAICITLACGLNGEEKAEQRDSENDTIV